MLDFERLLQEQPGGLLSPAYAQLQADVADSYTGDSHGRQQEIVAEQNADPRACVFHGGAFFPN